MKRDYRNQNLYTFEQLCKALGTNKQITIHSVTEGDFKHYKRLEDLFYKELKTGTIQPGHIFTVETDAPTTMKIWQDQLGTAAVSVQDLQKHITVDRNHLLRDAKRGFMSLDPVAPTGIKEIKQIKLYTKWRKLAPAEFVDIIYPYPGDKVMRKFKEERKCKAREIYGSTNRQSYKQKATPNPRREAMKALLMKKSPYMKVIKTTFLHSLALIKLRTKAICSDPTVSQRQQNWNTEFMVPILVSIHVQYNAYKKELTQTINYLDQIETEFDGATKQYIEQMEAVVAKERQTTEKEAKSVASSKGDRPQDFVEYDIAQGDTFPCSKCGHMMIMQLDTTETIAAYNHKPQFESLSPSQEEPSTRSGGLLVTATKQHCMIADKGGDCVRCQSKYQTGVEFLNTDPKELEEDTAPNTMPGLVSMIHDSIAEATHNEFLDDTTARKQDIIRNACSSVFFQMASNPHLGSPKLQKIIKEAIGPTKKNIDGKNTDQLRAKHKGKTEVPSNDMLLL
eukprot:jgi/Psemu1/45944/gm1.45944_g